jgi:hypothetical protein
MPVETRKEHQWLQRMVGEWTYEMEAEAEPGEPPIRDAGTESVRSLEVWVLAEATGTTAEGTPATSIMTLGYDPDRGRFTGTFIGTMMTYLWIYEGQLDADQRVLTLEAEGPSFTGDGGMAKYRDTIEFQDDDQRMQTSSYQRGDGTWHPFMTIHYRRTK